MTGDESPLPGTSTFHLTFLVSLHSMGGDAWTAVPFPVGPRQCPQFSAMAIELSEAKARARHAAAFEKEMGTSG
jgi:hypothetical protein